MKKLIIGICIIAFLLIGFFVFTKYSNNRTDKWKDKIEKLNTNKTIQNGDIIFQTSLSDQSKAIQKATNSKYSHCGIIFEENNKFYVLEAIQSVKSTPLEKWMKRGKDEHYVGKRLKNSPEILTTDVLKEMKQIGNEFLGKNYDLTFEWSDEKIYCSELIWKIYKRTTGLEIGKLEKLGDFDLENETVKAKLKERYGDKIPLDEIVISPESIFQSNLLMTIDKN